MGSEASDHGQIGHKVRLNYDEIGSSKVKFPTPGEREGVKCPWYAWGGGQGLC